MTALNIAPFIEADSDRIVGDDLIAGPQTYTVASIEGMVDEKKKKRLVIRLDGAQKPFIPCKGMARLLGHLWGPDAAAWHGRTMVLYRDPDVRFGADMTGGVRICAVSNIDKAVKVPIRTSQKSVKAYDIEPIKSSPAKKRQTAAEWASDHIAAIQNAETLDSLSDLIGTGAKPMVKLESENAELWADVNAAYAAARARIEQESKPVSETGEGFTDADDDGEGW